MSIYSITPLGENPSENYHLLAADLQNACKIAYSSYSTDGLLSYGILKSPTEIVAGIANGTITAEPTLPIIGATSAVNVQLYQLNKAAYEAYKEAGNKIKDALIMSAGQHIFCLREPASGYANVSVYQIYQYLDGLYGKMNDVLSAKLYNDLHNHKVTSNNFDAELHFYDNIFFLYTSYKEPLNEVAKIDTIIRNFQLNNHFQAAVQQFIVQYPTRSVRTYAELCNFLRRYSSTSSTNDPSIYTAATINKRTYNNMSRKAESSPYCHFHPSAASHDTTECREFLKLAAKAKKPL